MNFLLATAIGYLTLLSSTIAAPTPNPDSIVINIGGQDVTISSPGPVSFVSTAGANISNSTPNAKAVYFISNVGGANAVVALKVAANGALSYGSSTLTGGSGMNGISDTGGPAAPDALFSQGAVKVAGNMMVAVNPGDNTMTMFTISPTDPTILTMVGTPTNTQGEFPVSVTLSETLNQACVANSGAKAGVACFSMSATNGLTPLNTTSIQPFNLGQTTPPAGPFNTVSQVFFNEDSTALMTTVKGTPSLNTTGFLSIVPVTNDIIDGTKETRISPPGTKVLFGTANVPGNTSALFVTDASFGSATLSLSSYNNPTISAKTPILDQSATCWATISDSTKTAFVTDVNVNHLVEVDYTTGQLIKEYTLSNGNSGMIDLAAAGNFIYALSPGNTTYVTVFDVSAGRGMAKMVQNFAVNGVGSAAQGMTVF